MFSFVLVLLGRTVVQCCLAVVSLVSWGEGHSSSVKMLSFQACKSWHIKMLSGKKSLFKCVFFLHSFFFHINFLGMSNALSLRKHSHSDITIVIYSSLKEKLSEKKVFSNLFFQLFIEAGVAHAGTFPTFDWVCLIMKCLFSAFNSPTLSLLC